MKFNLPPEITFTKTMIHDQWVYTFRHNDLGNIGRIRLEDKGTNTMLHLDVIGDPNDPMTKTRREIFEPIGMEISKQMDLLIGSSSENSIPTTPPPIDEKTLVKSKILQCEKCDAYIGMLIFADNAFSPDRLEDYAQMMYPNYSRMNLPTWIIGTPLANTKNAPAYVLKVWPERVDICLLTPEQFNPIIDRLQESHCS